MRKINHNLAPDYLTKMFTSTRSNGSTYTIRQSQNYSIPKCRLKFYIYLNHLLFQQPQICGMVYIPLKIRNLPTLNSFKKGFLSSIITTSIIFFIWRTLRECNSHQTSTQLYFEKKKRFIQMKKIIDSPICSCGKVKDAYHIFLVQNIIFH